MPKIKNEILLLVQKIKSLDRKIIIIFIAVALLQTISWYITSRRFFYANFNQKLGGDPDYDLYSYAFWLVGDFITFFLLTSLIIRFIHREKISSFGLAAGDVRAGISYSLLFLIAMIPLIWIASAMPEFAAKYPHLQSAKYNWIKFLLFELCMLLYMFGWEFIWRGYVLFGLYDKFGYYAVLIQMIPFVILHNGKPFAETMGAIPGGIALGILALRAGSFIYCVIVHFGVMFLIDLISVLRARTESYGAGFDSLFEILSKIF